MLMLMEGINPLRIWVQSQVEGKLSQTMPTTNARAAGYIGSVLTDFGIH
jgi:hypothetical protein